MDSLEKFRSFVKQFEYKPENRNTDNKRIQNIFEEDIYRYSSKGEKNVCDYLRENNICPIREYKFEDLRDTNPLRFDFFIPKYNLFIEVDGLQHYGGSKFHIRREEWVRQINHDEMKNNYCKKNGYSLLRIPTCCTEQEFRKLIQMTIHEIEKGNRIFMIDVYFRKKAGMNIFSL